MNVFNILAPVIAVIALGAWLGGRGRYAAEFFRDANRLTYHIGLPALLFREVAAASLRDSWSGRVMLALLAATVFTALCAAAYARLRRFPRPQAGALIACAYRGNLAYAGLPILIFALSPQGMGAARSPWTATASLCLGPMVLLYNASVVILGALLQRGPKTDARLLIREVATNPLILASAGGLAVSAAGLPLPTFPERTLKIIGNMALPMALLGLGASFDRRRLREVSDPALAATFLKIGLSPLAGWALARWIGLGPEETLIALVYLSCPTAVAMFVMSKPLGMDEHLSGASIMLTTLLSIIPLSLILWRFAP